MLLSLSSQINNTEVNLNTITKGQEVDAGLTASTELIAFADNIVLGPEEDLARARENLINALGPQAMVDSAAIIANFSRMVRIADATGIPLDAVMEEEAGELRKSLGLNSMAQGPESTNTR